MTLTLENASKIISKLINGAQVDQFIVSSLVIKIGLFNPQALPTENSYVWLQIMGKGEIYPLEKEPENACNKMDLFDFRRVLVAKLFDSIGLAVSFLSMNINGTLTLAIGEDKLVITMDEDDYDEVWGIYSNENCTDSNDHFISFDATDGLIIS